VTNSAPHHSARVAHDRCNDVGLRAESALSAGLALKRWWMCLDAANAYSRRFDLIRAFNDPEVSFGFFERARLPGCELAVLGEVEDRLFDYSKSADVSGYRDQLREFVLRYLIRVSDFRRPSVSTKTDISTPKLLRPLSWCPDDGGKIEGFGYSQHWYKLQENATIGQFLPDERYEIIDLRELGRTYEWIVAQVRVFDFSVGLSPFGKGRPQVVVPLEEASYVVLHREFIVDENEPSADAGGQTVIGRYGFGYAFVRGREEELLAYGPGQFDVAFQQIVFRVYANGETRVQLVFVANRPNKVANVQLAPIDWAFGLADAFSFGVAAPLLEPVRRTLNRAPLRLSSFDPVSIGVDLTNLLTGGGAEKQFCISHEQLEKAFLLKHFDQHYQMISGALQTWRQIPDWMNESALPEWVRTGVSA
jgi:hypothetical protein